MTKSQLTPEKINAIAEELAQLPSKKQEIISRKDALKVLTAQIKELHLQKGYDVKTIATIIKQSGFMITQMDIKRVLGIKVYPSKPRHRVPVTLNDALKTTDAVSEDESDA